MDGEAEDYPFGKIRYDIGQKIGNATYLGDVPCKKDRKALFKCSCGNTFTAWIHSVKSNITKSCGCYRKEYMRNKQTKHGLSKHPLYNVHGNMIERCYNKDSISYGTYGAKGVRVCDEWRSDFVSFYNWCMNNGWVDGLQLDKDFNGTGLLYSPETCCFVTPKVNSNRRCTSRFITFNNETKTLAQWSGFYNISQGTLFARLKSGWTISDALLKKVRKIKHGRKHKD